MKLSKCHHTVWLFVFQFLLVCNAFAQSTIAWLEIPVGPGNLQGLSGILEDRQNYTYSQYVDVQSGSLTFSDVPAFVDLTLTLDPSYSYKTQSLYGWDNGLYCQTEEQITISSPSIDCASYDFGTTPGFDDSCTWSQVNLVQESSTNIMQLSVITGALELGSISSAAIGSPVAYADVYVSRWEPYYSKQVQTDVNGIAHIPACGELSAGESITVDIYHDDHIPFSGDFPVLSPISSTLDTIELPGGANATIQVSLVDKSGNAFAIPSGEGWADVFCYQSYDSYDPSLPFLPSPFSSLQEDESGVELNAFAGIEWECSFQSEHYQSKSVSITPVEGQTNLLTLVILEPISVAVRLQDDKGQSVSIPVFVDFAGSQADDGSWTNDYRNLQLGNGNDDGSVNLLEGGFYQVWLNPDYTLLDPSESFPKAPDGSYYLFNFDSPQTLTAGYDTAQGQLSSLDIILPTTTSVVQVSATGPNGALEYAWVDINCYKPGEVNQPTNDPYAFSGNYGGPLDMDGQGTFPIPENKNCDVQILAGYDKEGLKLIATKGRESFRSIQPGSQLSATFSFVVPDYILNINLEFPEELQLSNENSFIYCDGRTSDGKSAWGDSFESGVANQVSLGLLKNTGETWQFYCHGEVFNPENYELGAFYRAFEFYTVKSTTSIDNVTFLFEKISESQRFEEEYSFQNQQDATLSFPFGEVKIPALTFGENGSTKLVLSTTDEDAKTARPNRPFATAPVSFKFEGSEGEGQQPAGLVHIRFYIDKDEIENKFGSSLAQVIIAHYNPETRTWEEQETWVGQDESGRYYVEAQVKEFSVWSTLVDISKTLRDQLLSELKSTRTSKKSSKARKVNYQLSCSEDKPGIYEFRVRTVKKTKIKKKSKKKKKKKKNESTESADPWDGVDTQTAENCELNVKMNKGQTYYWGVRINNNPWSEDKVIKVKDN